MSLSQLFSPRQARAARALLGWTVQRLAAASDLDPSALAQFEAGAETLDVDSRQRLGTALRRAGVIPIRADRAGEGVRLRRPHFDRSPMARTACAEFPAWLPLGGDQVAEPGDQPTNRHGY